MQNFNSRWHIHILSKMLNSITSFGITMREINTFRRVQTCLGMGCVIHAIGCKNCRILRLINTLLKRNVCTSHPMACVSKWACGHLLHRAKYSSFFKIFTQFSKAFCYDLRNQCQVCLYLFVKCTFHGNFNKSMKLQNIAI